MIRKLTKMPYAQAHITTDEYGAITLVSYTTNVVVIDPHGWLTCSGLYSQTTRRHISAFMSEYTPFNFQMAKRAYKENFTINIYTGEIKMLGEG